MKTSMLKRKRQRFTPATSLILNLPSQLRVLNQKVTRSSWSSLIQLEMLPPPWRCMVNPQGMELPLLYYAWLKVLVLGPKVVD